ncbi:MAG: HD-GYP domain-containing protein, partial [Actinobacteria bacterium]|nr:HD-GYP domain-containing protein [Actinomycetota bacterium]
VLMRLSLLFPDQAPSRLKAALKGGSSRRLGQLVDATRANGLDDDPGRAARQVIELIGALGDHDRRTRGHSERVRLYAEMLGEELKLSLEERQKLQWGALLHDLGKLMVPPEILNKPGKPTVAEWAVIEKHPAAGMQLIEPLRPFLGEWVDAIGGHHEKWDGTGYPRRLKGSEIPRAGAIVAVADSYEVMVAVRSYKKGMSPTDARAELTRCAGTHFSPEVVRAFVSISIGRLRLIAGPLAALAQVPFLGTVVQLPSALTTVPAAFSSALMPATAAAAALVAGITLSSPVLTSTAGSGSVVLQAASAGEAPVRPVAENRPWKVCHDHPCW